MTSDSGLSVQPYVHLHVLALTFQTFWSFVDPNKLNLAVRSLKSTKDQFPLWVQRSLL